MLTPQSRALFAAAYSALLLTSERDEADQVPGASASSHRPDSGDANSRPEPEPADPAADAPVTDIIADPEGRA